MIAISYSNFRRAIVFTAGFLILAGLSGLGTPATAQTCEELSEVRQSARVAYLRLRHDQLMAERSLEIISSWREEYEDPDLLNGKHEEAEEAQARLELDTEQAENEYHSAAHAQENGCEND